MKHHSTAGLALLVFFVLLLGSCAPGNSSGQKVPSTYVEAQELAKNTTVRFYHWGGSETINKWLDENLAPALLNEGNLTLERVPMDASAFVEKLAAEKESGKQTGSIDLVWINGENFKRAREADLIFGPITSLLPNFQSFVDPEQAAWDFGTPTQGYESPWGRAQLVFETDRDRVPRAPGNLAELKEWIQAHPGRFTYPELPDFTGSAFIRQTMIGLAGSPEPFLGTFTEEAYLPAWEKLKDFLLEIKPYLWQKGESYPKSSAELDLLFARGEVDFNMSYTQAHAQNKIDEGLYPKSVHSFVLSEGALANTHFVAIPFNAPNKAGALVLANILLSPTLQLSKNKPANWGDFTILDTSKLNTQDRQAFQELDLGSATLPVAVLSEAALPELPAAYVSRLEKDWKEQILRAKQ